MQNQAIDYYNNAQFDYAEQFIQQYENWLSFNIFSYDLLADYVSCIDVLLNQYFHSAGIKNVTESVDYVYDYLNDWLPKHQSTNAIMTRRHMSALKHFYNFLNDEGLIDSTQLEQVSSIIEDNRQRWLANRAEARLTH